MSDMRLVRVDTEGVHVETGPVPTPGPLEVQVGTTVTGVCGSDVHASHGRHPFIPLPYRPGHEVVGTVAAVGDGVDSVTVGQRVTVMPTLPCGHCKMCTTGRENLCENLQFFGCGWSQGGMADLFTIDAGRLYPVPDDLDDRAAAMIEPLSTPVHAARLAGGVAGRAVVILGAGTIGLLMLSVVRYQGAKRVVVTDVMPKKRERALRLGADVALDPSQPGVVDAAREALGESADVVFDCVAIERTVRDAVGMAVKGGTVVVVGVPSAEITVPLPVMQDQQVRLQGSATYVTADYDESVAMLRAGAVAVDEIVTSDLPLDDAARGFELASSGEQVKVLLHA